MDPLSLRNQVMEKRELDHCARQLEPVFTELHCEAEPLAGHDDPFINHLILKCSQIGLKVNCGLVKFSKWNSDTETYDEKKDTMIRIMDNDLGYQLYCVPTDHNSMMSILMISVIGATEQQAVCGKGFYVCKRFIRKLRKVFFDTQWPQGSVKGDIVKGLQGTVKGATQLAVLSNGKTTSFENNPEKDWRNSNEFRWANLERFKGQNRLCVFWRLMGFVYFSDSPDGYPQLTLINNKSLHQFDEETRKEIENKIIEQQKLIHFKDYEKTI
ncbi:MAG: hypothetical protein CMI30_13095 [Opitutae bacterium]|nr:hypothetical protein [Opitutae bacterium]